MPSNIKQAHCSESVNNIGNNRLSSDRLILFVSHNIFIILDEKKIII